jgi:hypothetical protein
MIPIDPSVSIDHLRLASATLTGRLYNNAAVVHPWVTGARPRESSPDAVTRRGEVLGLLRGLTG